MSERKTITITVPYTSRMTSTADEDFIGARGGTGKPRLVLIGHANIELAIEEEDVGRAVLAAWPTEPAADWRDRVLIEALLIPVSAPQEERERCAIEIMRFGAPAVAYAVEQAWTEGAEAERRATAKIAKRDAATDYAKRLAEIEAREVAATKGPWFDTRYHDDDAGPHIETTSEMKVAYCALNVAEHSANGTFIAHAREDLPFLLARTRAASEVLTAAGIPDDGRPLAERIASLVKRLRGAEHDARLLIGMQDRKTHDDHVVATARREADILKRSARAAAITLGEQVPEDAGPETIAATLRKAVDDSEEAGHDFAETQRKMQAEIERLQGLNEKLVAEVQRARRWRITEGPDMPTPIQIGENHRWVTLIFREGGHLPTTCGFFEERKDAEQHYSNAGWQWSDSYLCEVVRSGSYQREEAEDAAGLTEKLGALQAALRAAKVLAEDGTLGEAGADILRCADMLRRVENGVTVEHRCADPSACPLCSAMDEPQAGGLGLTREQMIERYPAALAKLMTDPDVCARFNQALGGTDDGLDDHALLEIQRVHTAAGDDDAQAGTAAHRDRGVLLREVYRLKAALATLRHVTDRGDERAQDLAYALATARRELARLADVRRVDDRVDVTLPPDADLDAVVTVLQQLGLRTRVGVSHAETPSPIAPEPPPAVTGSTRAAALAETALLDAHRRADAKPTPEERHEARRRMSRSYSVPETCVRHDGCRIDGGDVVWPDGERWPTKPAQEGAAS